MVCLPLSKEVSFKALLQCGNRVQVPRVVRWQFKLESSEVLRVTVKVEAGFVLERFFGRMNKDGRITVPWLALSLLQRHANAGKSMVGYALDVRIAPAGQSRKPLV